MADTKRRVLIVDDEQSVLAVLSEMLRPLGCEVALATSGQDALEEIAAQPPDIVLSDVAMPGMNGIDLLRRLKSQDETRAIPVMMITALGDVEDRIRAIEAGADDFLTKPVRVQELQVRVRALLKVKAYYDHLRDYQRELEQEVAKRTEQLEQMVGILRDASLETVYRLSRAAEYRDEDTGSHVRRVGRYSELVARTMGLNDGMAESILYAAPMHDVGKIGIPDRILLKPGKLDPAEWEIMKQHTVLGSDILKGAKSDLIRLAETIAVGHHEKWDGSGYPKGLRKDETPVSARITAAADVFDALTSDRPYRKALPPERAFEIIGEGRGTHFDPDVADAFLAKRDEALKIRAECSDNGPSLLERLHRQLGFS